ncbi:MAG TPA: hypothetical protein P5119_08170 [Candidatus Aminicenantes bacterium]|nr:hypothetical protein [Candidatus Aminicenantes bacterium]HRY65302.1 hypothetical protein [Candidatus Aminicenantes bacterium]HRZ72230.1 hypothetical protein [Candidatus Aminicenantes bacterium]
MKKIFGIACVLGLIMSLPVAAAAQGTKFTIDLSGAFLTRAAGSTIPLVSSDYANPGTGDIFTSDSIALDAWKAGGDLRLGYAWGKLGVEVRGFLMAKPKASAVYTNNSGAWMQVGIEFESADGYGLPDGGVLTAMAQDDKPLLGLEANATYALTPKIQLYGGFRYFQLSQAYDLTGQFSSEVDDYEIDIWSVKNKLFGGQVGARVDILCLADGVEQGFTAQGHGAVLLLSNNADVVFQSSYGSEPDWADASGSASKIAPGVDAGFQVGYRLNRLIEFHVGYDLLWLGGMGEAVRQTRSMDGYGDETADPQFKSFIVHGAKAGVTVRF